MITSYRVKSVTLGGFRCNGTVVKHESLDIPINQWFKAAAGPNIRELDSAEVLNAFLRPTALTRPPASYAINPRDDMPSSFCRA